MKTIHLVDEAFSFLPLLQESILEFLITLPIELEPLRNDEDAFSVEQRTIGELEGKKKEGRVRESLGREMGEVEDLKKQLGDAKRELTVALRMGNCEKASQLQFATLPDLQGRLPKERAAAEAAGM